MTKILQYNKMLVSDHKLKRFDLKTYKMFINV